MSNKRIRQKQSKTTKTMDEYEKHLLNLIHEKRNQLKTSSYDTREYRKTMSELLYLCDTHQHLRIFQLK